VRRIGRATDAIKWQISSSKYRAILGHFETPGSNLDSTPYNYNDAARYSAPYSAASRTLVSSSTYGLSPPQTRTFSYSISPPKSPLLGTGQWIEGAGETITFGRHVIASQPKGPTELACRGHEIHEVMGNTHYDEPSDSNPHFEPEVRTAEPFPYSWGLGHLSNSLYENQFPISLGGTGSSLASGYSVLGSVSTEKGKGKALQPFDRKDITRSHPVIKQVCTGIRVHTQTQGNGQGARRNHEGTKAGGSETVSPHSDKVTDSGDNHGSGSNEEDEDNDDDDGNNRKRKRFHSPVRGQDKREFACPYHIYDPETYGISDKRYRVCAGTRFRFISELE
jgi:hypothetical protein